MMQSITVQYFPPNPAANSKWHWVALADKQPVAPNAISSWRRDWAESIER
jgi:hypothetical protein